MAFGGGKGGGGFKRNGRDQGKPMYMDDFFRSVMGVAPKKLVKESKDDGR